MGTAVTKDGNVTKVVVEGRLDTSTIKEFETAIQPLLALESADIVIDCKTLTYINSSGLRVFISLLKSVKANKGTLVLENMNVDVKGVFDMTGFSNLFTIR